MRARVRVHGARPLTRIASVRFDPPAPVGGLTRQRRPRRLPPLGSPFSRIGGTRREFPESVGDADQGGVMMPSPP